GEVIHILQEDRRLHDIGKIGSSGSEHRLKIHHHLSCLCARSSFNQGFIGLERDLTGSEDKALDFHSLRIGSDRSRSLLGEYYLFVHSVLIFLNTRRGATYRTLYQRPTPETKRPKSATIFASVVTNP